MSISVILLAGGVGKRMAREMPKQFLFLREKPIALYSLEVFLSHPEVSEVVVVCEDKYRTFFDGYPVKFANPGERRQDSLFEGLKKSSPNSQYVCVHDSARPFIHKTMLTNLFDEGKKMGAAAVGMPVKWTVKETEPNGYVRCTLNRERIWEVQTPQILRKNLLVEGFEHAYEQGITVTDDVSLAELIGHPVKMVPGSYLNIKITTPEDLIIAECISIN